MNVPRGLHVEERGEPQREGSYRDPPASGSRRLIITRPWIDRTAGLGSMSAVLADGIAAVALVFAHGHPIGLAIGGLLAAAGAYATYDAAGKTFNRTRLSVGGGELTVLHGPLPWPGARTIPLDTIVRVRAVGGKIIAVMRSQNAEGTEIRLVDDLDDAQAQFIAARIASEIESAA